ncbi:MAG: hypothetical protein O7D30_03655, partial [Rickettsia endosymbiont of Ixodes persulcatus]|nr:hypothetical protein [Rickettsia endosymbiont of Ixodes persulcatus]
RYKPRPHFFKLSLIALTRMRQYTPFPHARSHLEYRHFWYAVKHVFDLSPQLEGGYEKCVIVTHS